jgi:WD40 repeat protein
VESRLPNVVSVTYARSSEDGSMLLIQARVQEPKESSVLGGEKKKGTHTKHVAYAVNASSGNVMQCWDLAPSSACSICASGRRLLAADEESLRVQAVKRLSDKGNVEEGDPNALADDVISMQDYVGPELPVCKLSGDANIAFAAYSTEALVGVWDVASGAFLARLFGHSHPISGISANHPGTVIVSTSEAREAHAHLLRIEEQ